VFYYDPVQSDLEVSLLRTFFNMNVWDNNAHGRVNLDELNANMNNKFLLYMPHCPASLYVDELRSEARSEATSIIASLRRFAPRW